MPAFLKPNGRRRPAAWSMAWIAAAFCGIGHGTGAWAEPATHTVVISGMQFVPQVLEVSAGDTVVWINKDAFPHNASATDNSFRSGEMPTNGAWQLKAARKGSVSYICTLHPTMKARLIVK